MSSSTKIHHYVGLSSTLTLRMASFIGTAVHLDFTGREAELAFPSSQPIYFQTRVAACIKFSFCRVAAEVWSHAQLDGIVPSKWDGEK